MAANRRRVDGLCPLLIMATTSAMEGTDTHVNFTFGGMKLLTESTAAFIEPAANLGLPKEQLTQLLSREGTLTLSQMLKQARKRESKSTPAPLRWASLAPRKRAFQEWSTTS
jgi:peroxiredoxin family protein